MTDGDAPPTSNADTSTGTVAADNNAPAPVPTTIHHDDHQNGNSAQQHERDEKTPGRLTPRPTYMEHLASSREMQFHLDRRDSTDVDRYFVCGVLETPKTRSPESQPRLTNNLIPLAWPERYGQAFKMANLHAYAWKYYAENDPAVATGSSRIDCHYYNLHACLR